MLTDRLERDLMYESHLVKEKNTNITERLSRLAQLKSRLFPLIEQNPDLQSFGSVCLNSPKVRMEIRNQYEMTSFWLNHVKPNAIHKITTENLVMNQIIKCTKLKCISSAWIGSFNFDIFIPGFGRGERRGKGNFSPQGMAIEVNGSVHDREGKQIKDEYKSDLLYALGITSVVINNDERKEKTVKDIIRQLANRNYHLDFRAKNRVWMRVYLATINSTLNDHEWKKFLSLISKNN